MTQVASTYTPAETATSWFRRAEAWLDDKGKGAWIATMVLGFIFVWPVGLALLFYMIWSKRMFACKSRPTSPFGRGCGPRHSRHERFRSMHAAMRPSGNTAFDAYKEETLKRLEEEQDQFEAFLERLRAAKDKAEFDQFMDDRARRASEERTTSETDQDDKDQA
ncbi:DUF2852 domain-containing protein [Celeribacter persicus]|jgi:Protein of unknown function (DUF2852).|uniref:Uncharacterized protein DUF2852 n=1 Tax=Celeribacter persicus TaxID=1651082 RepID=A0A2T5HBK1_9RHOB|nr:DUF2852 domain-containing protein [Celeribacter persicus]PTQ68922.1 uncharacterized protein DUF2852 [Celeribacter persicus]